MKKRLSLLLFLVIYFILPGIFVKPATAQVTPDGTTNTTVDAQGNDFTIQNGDRTGNNLFHSFQDFSVPNGGSTFFNNADNIVNIFSRVTGGNISDIQGAIRANGSADLFLINPAGIIFGENASLNIGGSFYGSSASSILFGDGEFSAVDNLDQPILTINAPIGLGFRSEPGDIVNQSINNGNGLLVNTGETIALFGGNINLERGLIFAPSGRVELGGLSAAGEIGINADGSFNFPDGIERANVTLTEEGRVSASTFAGTPNSVENSGEININTNNLSLTLSSVVDANTEEGNAEADAGAITVNASDTISVEGANSGIFSQVGAGAVGNAGGINLNTANLSLTQAGVVTAGTGGQGDGGTITVNALDTISVEGANSGIFSQVEAGTVGDAGGINLNTANLSLIQGGVVTANTGGQGDGGTITVNALDTISVEGANSGIFSQVGAGAVGNAGGINLTTANLSLTQGGVVTAGTGGQGDGGTITVNASDTISVEEANSGIFSQVFEGVEGNAGEINLTTANLSLTQGGVVTASTGGQGNGGAITIKASDTISAEGETPDGSDNSGIFSQVFEGVEGNAGEINLTTANLSLTQGGVVTASTGGQGNGGAITIKASDTISAEGETPDGSDNSGIFSQVFEGVEGNAGEINLTTVNLSLTQGGQVDASTLGEGNAGDVTINASESTIISDVNENLTVRSGLYANALGDDGNGGNVNVITDQLTIDDGGTINVGNFDNSNASEAGTGEPGNIKIEASSINLSNEASIEAATKAETGSSANINLQVDDSITLEDNSLISAQAFENANGGNLTIDTNFVVAFPSQEPGNGNDLIATAEDGSGGDINITAESLLGIQERTASDENGTNDIDASSNVLGLDGTINIDSSSINPIQGATELPRSVVESQQTVAQACRSNIESGNKSNFTIDGKGGVTPAPDLPLDSQNVLINGNVTNSISTIPQPIETSQGKIQPARGVLVTKSGKVILTAYRTSNLDNRLTEIKPNCRNARNPPW